MDNLAVASSWSGGKDSCLASYKAMRQGYRVKNLLNFISRESRRGCFHGIENKLMQMQADALGISLIQEETTADMQEYEKEFKMAIAKIKSSGIERIVFGDIYLDEHKEWVDRVCSEVGVQPLEPLWNQPAVDLAREFVRLGFKAIIVSAQADKFDQNFVGKEVNADLIDELVSRGICPCGENGEFHTFVLDGPIFKNKIEILESEPVLKKGFWDYWFLDIKKYRLSEGSPS